MKNALKRIGAIAILSALTSASSVAQQQTIVTIDRLVAHVSTVPAVKGQRVDLFVREKVREGALRAQNGEGFLGHVVLLVHGGYSPGVLAFDVPYRDYSWAEFKREFYAEKPCAPMCTVGCVQQVAMIDNWRAPQRTPGSGKPAHSSPLPIIDQG